MPSLVLMNISIVSASPNQREVVYEILKQVQDDYLWVSPIMTTFT